MSSTFVSDPGTTVPDLWHARQLFARQREEDIEEALERELEALGDAPFEPSLSPGAQQVLPGAALRAPSLAPGAEIAVAVGSRGIANLALIVKTTIAFLRRRGFRPFIVPAMGSHGGATAEGQRALLEGYGVTESAMGAPIRSSMEVVELPDGGIGNRVFMDRAAHGAAGTIVINRVKPHTDFHGAVESGLLKMCVLGLGKHAQALEIHSFGVTGLIERILPSARQVLRRGNILFGIGIVENAYDETMVVRAIPAARIEAEERELLELARRSMPRLPVDAIDLLVIDEMGKNLSGSGIDPNIIGRIRVPGQPEPDAPRIGSIVVADLTAESHGNAIGMGLADIITRRLYDKIDLTATYENTITSTFLDRGKIPVIAGSIREAIAVGLRTCGRAARFNRGELPRIARIRSTLHVDELFVSAPIADELRSRADVELARTPSSLLDERGELTPFPMAATLRT